MPSGRRCLLGVALLFCSPVKISGVGVRQDETVFLAHNANLGTVFYTCAFNHSSLTAIDDYRSAMELDPTDAHIQNDLALLLGK